MSILTLLWKFRDYIMVVMILTMIFGYWWEQQHTISKEKKQIVQLQAENTQLKTLNATQLAQINQQNTAVNQLKQYSDQKDAEIKSATALAESLQDEIDLKASQILERDTKIQGDTSTLKGCTDELQRIKDFMVQAEQDFKSGK